MTFIKWIIPEPDPKLSLRVQDININTLNYKDIRFIYSSAMIKYIHEFKKLSGFINIAHKIIEEEKGNRIMKKNIYYEEGIPPYNKKRVSSIKINHRVDNKKTYLETIDSYGKYFPHSQKSPEVCSVS